MDMGPETSPMGAVYIDIVRRGVCIIVSEFAQFTASAAR